MTLTTHPLLVPLSRKSRAISLKKTYGPYGLYRASVPVQGCTLLTCFTTHHNSFLVAESFLPFLSQSRNCPPLIEPEGSVSCLQHPAIGHFLSHINPFYAFPTDYLTSILILSFSLRLGLSSAHTAYQGPGVSSIGVAAALQFRASAMLL